MFSALRNYNRTIIVFVVIALYASLFFLQKTNLVTSDLGRHVMNGKLVWLTVGQHVFGDRVFEQALHDSVGQAHTAQDWQQALQHSIFTTNTYSYTAPDFEVINHHWLFGVISYAVFLVGGFSLLTVGNAIVVGSAIFITLVTAGHFARWQRVVVVAALLLPLVTNRVEIRPESSSLLLSAVYIFVLLKATRDRLSWSLAIPLLVILQLIWVNTHIFFILGWALVGVFWLESLFGSRAQLQKLSILGGAVVLASLGNPTGMQGLVAPFQIFGNYDFLIAENQTTFFMLRVLPKPEHWYYLVVLAILTVCGVVVLGRLFAHKRKPSSYLKKTHLQTATPWILFVLLLAGAGLALNRLYSFFGLLALPPLAWFFEWIWQKEHTFIQSMVTNQFLLPLTSLLGFSFLWIVVATGLFFPSLRYFGTGTLPGTTASAQFFAAQHLSGPVFNNYDIGGYLIFTLFPQERVFTDNRPEAYPPGFFTAFKQAQADPALWEKLLAERQFSSIYFHRNDMTDHGQEFLIARIQDPKWAPVFVDAQSLILVKRSPENAAVISQHELPQSMFSISSPK